MHEHEYDKDRTRSPAKTARADYEYRMLAPGSVSMSSFLQRPEHPIPSGLTDYKLSPVPPDRAPIPQGDRGPEHGRSNAPRVVLLILPANLAPGSVSMSSFLQRPENPIPSWFSGDAAVAAYQERQRQASAVRPEDQALGDLLDATLERVRAKREAAAASASVAASAGPAVDAQKPETHEAQRAEPSAPVRLPSSVQARMERAFDRRFADVELHPESAEVPAGQQAFTRGRHIHLESGVDPTSSRGEKVLAHELAHVAQQDGSGGRAGSRQELEREAARAATLAMQGQTARIALRAESSTAYAFSEDHDHDHEHEDDEHERTNPEDAHHAGADTHESAKHEGNPATEPGGELSAASVAEVSAVVPAEDTPGAAPGVGGGPAAKPQKKPPNVAAAKPEHGLSQLRGVRPDKLGPVLGEVHTAASADVATARAAQHANPPKQMSTGAAVSAKGATPDGATARGAAPKHATAKDTAPKDAPPVTAAAPAAKDAADRPVKGEVPGGEATKQATQGAATEQQKTASEVITHVAQTITSWLGSWSSLFGTSDNANAKSPKMSEEESRQMAGSVDKIPTTTAGVSTDTGPAPELAMKGEARTSADRDRAGLEAKTASLETQGRADSRAPMGEDHIEATAPPEELTAMSLVAGTPAAAPATAMPTAMPTLASAPSEEVGIVAQEQHGAEVDAALAKASADVSVERGKHAEHEAQARAESDAQLRELKTQADTDQAAARDAAHAEVGAARAQWQTEIDKKGADARKQGDKKVAEGMAQVEAEETKANAEAKRHIEEGRQKADQEKQKGEKEAADAKEKAKHKSSGFWGWAASKARAAFDGVKKAVSSAIDACRRAVKAVIEGAKKLAMAAIELARKAINAAIKAIGAALLAISDVLLAAFPELKARFQGAIRKAVDKATAAVNRLADGLKQAVQKALDRLGAVLDQALQLLEKGINAIIDVANAVVQGAIKAAQAVVEMLGTWAKLIKDVVAGPGTWLGKLGSAVVDGIKNHLWSAFKTTVVEWFKSKVFELLGIGGIVLELLLEGGLTREHILEMAMDALLVAIPAALVAILIEKLVSMIVPAAGALMAIIEGLQAAWGTISRIIAAFAAFMAFLLAVKSGGAGPLFAAVLAGAAVVVLDFVANWLLKKLASAARKVGARLKGLAEKFKAKRKANQGGKNNDHHGNKDHDKKKDDDHPSSENDKKKDEIAKKVERAERELPSKIRSLLAKRPSRVRVKATFLLWRAQYGLKSLTIEGKGTVKFKATINPTLDLGNGWEVTWDDVIRAIHAVSQEFLDGAQGAPSTGTGAHGDPVKINVQDNPAHVANAVREKKGVVDVGSDIHAVHDDHPTRKDTTSIFAVGHAPDEKPPSYQRMMKDLEGVDVGRAFGQLLRGQPVDATPEQKAKLGVLFVTMFGMEPTHPAKDMGHARDLGNALMATQLLENKQVTLESLLTKNPTGKDLVEKESRKLPAVGIEGRSQPIQAGTQAVTGKVIGGEGYGPGSLPKTMLAERIRVEREINLFTQWIKATGELEKLEDRAPTVEDLKSEVRKRLKQFLAKKS